MKHPTREQWISYVYGEVSPEEKSDFEAHMNACGDCARNIRNLRRTMEHLDAWELAPALPSPRSQLGAPWIKWAAAALVVLGIGFGIGRISASAPDLEAFRTGIEQQLRAEFQTTLETAMDRMRQENGNVSPKPAENSTDAMQTAVAELKRLMEAHESKHVQQQQATLAALQALNTRVSQQAADLETVAVLTEAALRSTQQRLVQLSEAKPITP